MPTKQNIFEYGATKVGRAIVLKGVTADKEVPVPAGAVLTKIYIKNNTANAVTGGIRMGTASAGTQHLTAQAVGASQTVHANPTLIAVVPAAAGSIFIEAVTAWNSANLDIRIEYDEVLEPTYPELGRH